MLVSEDTLPKLSAENQHLQGTVGKLTAQLDDTESRLQAERAARKQLEESLESRNEECYDTFCGPARAQARERQRGSTCHSTADQRSY